MRSCFLGVLIIDRNVTDAAIGWQPGQQLQEYRGWNDQWLVQSRVDSSPCLMENKASVEVTTLEWVVGFNHHRPIEPLGDIPPAKGEANYFNQLGTAVTEPVFT
ncbi:hypothetical protein GCM10022212_07820 [Actimicrobium antarcticum]|uniref:Uncharacterized protein n=1 Tax=Actimicrobium antarcticum TaxID=1051899 RepID=A0ABP7SRU7_9BURK